MDRKFLIFLLIFLACGSFEAEIQEIIDESTEEATATDLEIVWCNAMVKKLHMKSNEYRHQSLHKSRTYYTPVGDEFVFLLELVLNQIESEEGAIPNLSDLTAFAAITYFVDVSALRDYAFNEPGYIMEIEALEYDEETDTYPRRSQTSHLDTEIAYPLDFELGKNKKLCKDWYSLSRDG